MSQLKKKLKLKDKGLVSQPLNFEHVQHLGPLDVSAAVGDAVANPPTPCQGPDHMNNNSSKVNCFILAIHFNRVMPASVAQLDAPSDWRPGGRGFHPGQVRQHSFVEIDHEIFSTVILSLPLIQEVQLSVSGERMCTILVNRLED